MNGHRKTLTPMQTKALAKPIRVEDRVKAEWLTTPEREAQAYHLPNPALVRWQLRRSA